MHLDRASARIGVDAGRLCDLADALQEAKDFDGAIEVYRRAIEVIGNADKAMRWLGRPIPALNFATPVSLLKNEKGRDAVLEVLGRLEHGVF